MSARYSQSFWVGIFVVLNLLPPVALADPAASAVQATSVTPVDPVKLFAQAEKALDNDELDTAMRLYTQAAELNYTPAQVVLGELADSAQIYEEAVGWFLMAATQGDATGQFDLARMYLLGNGIEKNDSKALYWARRSADKKFLPAVEMIVKAYQQGGFSGLVKVDLNQAKIWDDKAVRLRAIASKAEGEKLDRFNASLKKFQEEEAAKQAKKNK